MLIILSPSKRQKYTPLKLDIEFTQPSFSKETAQLMSYLRQLTSGELSDLMAISANLAELNQQRYQEFQLPITINNSTPALLSFKGDVYQPIKINDFSLEDFAFAQKHVYIISGLYGLLRPLDVMQPYRLEMATKLSTEQGKNLYEFWQDKLTKHLVEILKEHQSAYIINLASKEYSDVLNWQKIKHYNIIFKQYHRGEYKVIAIHAKKARGLMANYIIKNHLDNINDVKKIEIENYSFAEHMSDAINLLFIAEK